MRHYQPAFATGGVFYPTRNLLPLLDQVVLEIRFPQLVNKTMIRGQVAWCRSGQHRTKLRAGLGIEFHATEGRRRDYLLAVARGQGHKVVTRRHRRLPVSLPAQWRHPNERAIFQAVVEDIGPGGAFVRGGSPPLLGSEVILGVVPPGGVCPIEIAARVAWSRHIPGEDGFGVEFRSRDAGGVRRLKELVRRLEELEEQALLVGEPEEE